MNEEEILKSLPSIKCPKCQTVIYLVDFTDNSDFGCGWNWHCSNCERDGFVWEGAFDNE